MSDAKGALVAVAAYAVMLWLDRRPPSWWYGHRPNPPPTQPLRGEITRPRRGLERWRP